MRIVCPSCSAVYEVPDALLVAGKRTRCARCAREWEPQTATLPAVPPAPPEPVGGPPPPPLPAPVSPVPPPAAAPRAVRPPAASRGDQPRPGKAGRRHTLAVWIALGASVLILAGVCAAAVMWRAAAIGVFPPAERLYIWLERYGF